MNEELSRLIPIMASNLGAVAVMAIAKRWFKVGYFGQIGIYLILLPLGFYCFGWDLSPFFLAGFAVAGVFAILLDIKKNFTRKLV
jgi:hypothetical protein